MKAAPQLLAQITLATALATLPLAALADDTFPGKLSVSAQGEVTVAPDKATVSALLWETTRPIPVEQADQRDPEAMKKARQSLEARASDLITTLEGMGIKSERISAGSLAVRQESTYSRHSNSQQRIRLTHTKVQRPFHITLHDLEQVPSVMDAMTTAGVDQLSGVQYSLQDARSAERDALRKAVAKAKAEATIMADGLGETLDGVVNVAKGRGHTPRPMAQARMMADSLGSKGSGESAGGAEYRAGQIKVATEVNVTWALDR